MMRSHSDGAVVGTSFSRHVSGPSGVRVNCIFPGGVDMPMFKDEQILGFMCESMPLGHLARPDETARVAVFLASDEASYMNGAIVPVDGGWTRGKQTISSRSLSRPALPSTMLCPRL